MRLAAAPRSDKGLHFRSRQPGRLDNRRALEEEREACRQFSQVYEGYHPLAAEVLKRSRNKQKAGAANLFSGEMSKRFTEVP